MNLWPPYLGAGIRVRSIAADWSEATVELRQRRLNRNYVGTHFGGSLFAMTDPFYALLLMHRLGERHLVWDQAAVRGGDSRSGGRARRPRAQDSLRKAEAALPAGLVRYFVARSFSIAPASFGSPGSTRVSKLCTCLPLRSIKYLWKFQRGAVPVALARSA